MHGIFFIYNGPQEIRSEGPVFLQDAAENLVQVGTVDPDRCPPMKGSFVLPLLLPAVIAPGGPT